MIRPAIRVFQTFFRLALKTKEINRQQGRLSVRVCVGEREKVHGETNHLGPSILIGQTPSKYRYCVCKIVCGYFIPFFVFFLSQIQKQSLLSTLFWSSFFWLRETNVGKFRT